MHVAQHIIAMSLYYNIPPGLIKIDIYTFAGLVVEIRYVLIYTRK